MKALRGWILLVFSSFALLQIIDATKFSLGTKDSPDKKCIMLDIKFSIELQVFDKETGMLAATVVLTDEDVEDVLGSCAGTGGSSSLLRLRFANGTEWHWKFSVKNLNKNVYLKRLVLFHPHKVFGELETFKPSVTFTRPEEDILPNDGLSYACNSPQKFAYNFTHENETNYTMAVDSTESEVQVQAFNIKRNAFGAEFSCKADLYTHTSPSVKTTEVVVSTTPSNTSTTPSNTSTPISTPEFLSSTSPSKPHTTPALPPVNNFTVSGNGVTCISFSASISVTIRYPTDDDSGTKTAVFQIPIDASTSGKCAGNPNSTELLSISFLDNWVLNFTFNATTDPNNELQHSAKNAKNPKNPKSRRALSSLAPEDHYQVLEDSEAASYSLSNITLTYILERSNFPNLSPPNDSQPIIAAPYTDHTFPTKAPGASYYRCNSATTLKLNNNVQVTLSSLQFKAFNPDKNAQFNGTASSCYSDTESDYDIPIIAGSCVGSVFLLVAILFISKQLRRRNKIKRYANIAGS